MSANNQKWHEYGKTQYAFPEIWTAEECGDFYDAEYVDDWFKRCIEDYPRDNWDKTKTEIARHKWFNRWFSQFRKSQK